MSTTPIDDAQADSVDDDRLHRRKNHFSPPDSNAVDSMTAVLEDKEEYRRLLRSQGADAERILDALQQILDYTAPYSDLWKHGIVALQRLSVRTGLFPSMYELKGVKRLEEEAGPVSSGGYGEVYRGEHEGEKVCIKVLRVNQQDRKKVMKFYARETILWGQLSHRNIIPFYGICTMDYKPCLVSPWAANGNVIEYLKRNPHADRLALIRDISEGLHYLHAQEIVHGDLKGANVLVDLQGCACLADFGMSSVYDRKVLDWTSQSAAASYGGTVRWQAPELLKEGSLNTKQSDMYAWACACYEIFTGEMPYAETTVHGLVYMQKLQGIVPCNSSRRTQAWTDAGLNDDTWDLLHDCWVSEPETRPTIEFVIQAGRERQSLMSDDSALYRSQVPARASNTFFFFLNPIRIKSGATV